MRRMVSWFERHPIGYGVVFPAFLLVVALTGAYWYLAGFAVALGVAVLWYANRR